MRNIIILSIILLAGCAPQKEKPHHETKQVYHFADGRIAFQIDSGNDDDDWFYSAESSRSSNGSSSVWVRGPAPKASDLKEAQLEEEEVTLDENGEPIDPSEETNLTSDENTVSDNVVSSDTSGGDSGDSGGSSGGDGGE